ncbi:MAG: SDR family oxidoreductase [Myxococcota bacterium]
MLLPTTPSFRLDGKRAFVVGASSGIGQACAVALAEAGAYVTCAARSQSSLDRTVQAMQSKGLAAEATALDITDHASMRRVVDTLSSLDVFVNSAGLARHGPAMTTTEEEFDAVSSLNWKAAHFAAQAAAKKMKSSKAKGSIITISSQMGHVGGIDRSVYAASKHAVEGMTKAMAIEWGADDIRVNTICPTFIETPLTKSTFENPDRLAWIKSKIHLPRVGTVEDVMGATVFLASEASALITGSSILVDGGWTAG